MPCAGDLALATEAAQWKRPSLRAQSHTRLTCHLLCVAKCSGRFVLGLAVNSTAGKLDRRQKLRANMQDTKDRSLFAIFTFAGGCSDMGPGCQ